MDQTVQYSEQISKNGKTFHYTEQFFDFWKTFQYNEQKEVRQMILREHYISQIRPFYDSDLIKIITGIRRSGKSVILSQIKEELERTKFDSDIYVTVDTLKYLKKGGTITPAAAAIGTVLNLKPVLQLQVRSWMLLPR